MSAAERIIFVDGNTAWINVLAKEGKNLDIKFYLSTKKEDLYRKLPQEFVGVKNSFDIRIDDIDSPKLFYKIEYREGKKLWKSHAPREVKTPHVNLDKDEKLKIIMIGDDHLYADLKCAPREKEWKNDVLTGDYVSRMLKEIVHNPGYVPELNLREVVQGFSLAWALKYILETRPDFVITLGDTVGPDSYRVWGENGRWPELQPENDLEGQAKILWERSRKSLAAITPEIPYYLVSGNHDGENGWDRFAYYSRIHRQRVFGLPEFNPIQFKPVHPSCIKAAISTLSRDREFSLSPVFKGNHYAINWAHDDIQFIVLTPLNYVFEKPKKVTDWTLGENQKTALMHCLENNYEIPWKFICLHHTVGGYPLGSMTHPGTYGRGPLYTLEDYEKANEMTKVIDPYAVVDPDEVEQVWITELAKKFNVRGFFRGHDHVFFSRNNNNKPIGNTSLGKEMISACVGSTNFVAGNEYNRIWCNPYWVEFFGDFYEEPPKFWTQPGVTELEIDKHTATVKYVCSAPPECMCSNMPPGTKPGDTLFEHRLKR
jgi:hypothetical protein